MADTRPCLLCGKMIPTPQIHPSAAAKIFNCRTCGTFAIEDRLTVTGWSDSTKKRLYHLSALTKASKASFPPFMIDDVMVKRLNDGVLVDPPIRQKLEKIVRWVADQSTEIGQSIVMQPAHLYPIAMCRSEREWRVLVDEAAKMGLLVSNGEEALVTLKGWEWLTERPNATSSTAFIAMSFAEDLKPIKEAISKAITGGVPTRSG